jgi:hypothetical protein
MSQILKLSAWKIYSCGVLMELGNHQKNPKIKEYQNSLSNVKLACNCVLVILEQIQ